MKYPSKHGAALAFEGGSLNLNLRGYPDPGSGHFAFTNDELEPIREYDEDGAWDGYLVKLPSSELFAIRDFLNKWLPPSASPIPSLGGGNSMTSVAESTDAPRVAAATEAHSHSEKEA